MEQKPKKRKGAPAQYLFKPGQSGNPAGRPKNPIPDALKKATKQQYRRIVRMVVKGNVDHLEALANSKTASALEVAVAACFVRAIEKGDYQTVEHMLQRIVGKIPDELVVRSNNVNINANADVDDAKVQAAIDRLEKNL